MAWEAVRVRYKGRGGTKGASPRHVLPLSSESHAGRGVLCPEGPSIHRRPDNARKRTLLHTGSPVHLDMVVQKT